MDDLYYNSKSKTRGGVIGSLEASYSCPFSFFLSGVNNPIERITYSVCHTFGGMNILGMNKFHPFTT